MLVDRAATLNIVYILPLQVTRPWSPVLSINGKHQRATVRCCSGDRSVASNAEVTDIATGDIMRLLS